MHFWYLSDWLHLPHNKRKKFSPYIYHNMSFSLDRHPYYLPPITSYLSGELMARAVSFRRRRVLILLRGSSTIWNRQQDMKICATSIGFPQVVYNSYLYITYAVLLKLFVICICGVFHLFVMYNTCHTSQLLVTCNPCHASTPSSKQNFAIIVGKWVCYLHVVSTL